MIIDKSTSDTLLVNSLRIFDSSGQPLHKVKAFNTTTMVATKDDDSTVSSCVDFGFFIDMPDEEAVEALLDPSLYSKIVPGHKTSHGGCASMDYEVTDPDYFFVQQSKLAPVLLRCTSCSTNFVVFVDRVGELWSTERAQASDKHLTATQLDKNTLTCDNCSNNVSFTEEV